MKSIIGAVLCLVIGGFLAGAQEVRASLSGRVLDPQGAVVPNAEVSVTAESTNVTQVTSTNMQGAWTVQFLLPGDYTIAASAPGFQKVIRGHFPLQSADVKTVDLQLVVGETSQSIEVSEEVPLVDTTAATSGTVIEQKAISEMPTASHVATLLATMSPGVLAQDQNNNVVHLWSNSGASQVTANGGRNNIYSNNYQLDGMPNTKSGGYVSFIPPMDSLAEFRVQTNAYDASIGRQAGATINMQTRSGTKDYHGSLYEYNQNNILNANLFQTNLVGGSVAAVHFNEYGGTFGGPVWIPKIYDGKNKTFFFFSFDETRNVNPLGSGLRSVPTGLERTGDYSQSWTTQLQGGTRVKYPIMVYDPLTVNTAGNRTLFPGNKIPASRISSIASNIYNYVPLPNTPSDGTSNTSNNYVTQAQRRDTFPVVSARVDHNWSNTQHSFATVRWNHLDELSNTDFGEGNPATGNYLTRRAKSVGLDHVWTLGVNKILDLRYTLNRFEESSADAGVGFDPAQLGFSSALVSQLRKPSFPRITGIAGDFGTGQAGTYTYNTYHTWAASLTHVVGNHTLRYGGEFWVLQQASGKIDNQGQFDFGNGSNWTRENAINAGGVGVGSNSAAFLLGLPSGGNLPRNADAFYSQQFTGLFLQDDWRVTGRLTLNLGMRWDVERPVMERYDRLVNKYDVDATNPLTTSAQAAYAAMLANPANANNAGVALLKQILPASAFSVKGVMHYAGVDGVSRAATNTDWHEWQPRFGAAYRITNNTVIRGGIGRFTQADYVAGQQTGFSQTTSLQATQDSWFTPYDTLGNPFRNGYLSPVGSSLGAYSNLGSGFTYDNPNLDRPYSWEYSVHLQHQRKDWLFEIGYSHNKTYNIPVGWYMNLPSYALWNQYLSPQFDAKGRPLDTLAWNQIVPNPFYGLSGITTGTIATSKTVALNQLLNPSGLISSSGLTQNNPSGKNQYDAGLAKVERRFTNGFSLITSFTWSKLFEDTSFLGNQITGYRVEHKLGGEDRPLHLSIASIYELPFGRGKRWGGSSSRWMDALIGGWELSGQYNVQSGVPVVFSTDSFFSGKDFKLSGDQQSMSRWFDTSQFVAFPTRNTDISTYPAWTGVQNLPGYSYKPAAGDTIKNGVYQDFGNYFRTYPTRWNDVRASRVNEANIGLRKTVTLTERVRFQLRADAFNVFNHPRFAAPNTDPTSSSFGVVAPAQQNQARSIELAAKLYF